MDVSKALQLRRQRTSFIHSAAGRRSEVVITRGRGKYCRHKLPRGQPSDVALDATLRAAAGRLSTSQGRKLEVHLEDLREKIRRHRSPYLIVFVVDNSWSIHVDTSLERTKGVVLELLKDAHIHHDRVAMVSFRHGRPPDATVVLPPTSSYTRAVERLRKVPLTGSTPLPDAIGKAYHLLRQTRIKYENAIPVVVIITDGIPNVPVRRGGDPYEETGRLCRHLLWDNIATMIVDTEPRGSDAGRNYCRTMAALSGGRYLTLSELTRQAIEDTVVGRVGPRSSQRHDVSESS